MNRDNKNIETVLEEVVDKIVRASCLGKEARVEAMRPWLWASVFSFILCTGFYLIAIMVLTPLVLTQVISILALMFTNFAFLFYSLWRMRVAANQLPNSLFIEQELS